MALTSMQEIPNAPAPKKEPWTVRQLFPVAALSSYLKTLNVYELLMVIMVVTTGLGELLGREFSFYWFIVLILISFGAFYLRILLPVNPLKK